MIIKTTTFALLILTSFNAFSVGDDGTNGYENKITSSCNIINVGDDGTNGISSVGDDGTNGISSVGDDGTNNTTMIICEKTFTKQ